MYQPWIFGAAIAAGTGLVALTLTFQQPPSPVALPEASTFDAVRVVPPPLRVAEPPEASVLELEPIVIEGHRALPKDLASRVVESPASPVERPCSAWRDLGPTHLVLAKADNETHVRELCR